MNTIPLPHPDVQHVSRLFTTAAVKKTLHANGSWWCGCDRDTFYARLQENAERIHRNSLAYPMGSDGYAPEEAR